MKMKKNIPMNCSWQCIIYWMKQNLIFQKLMWLQFWLDQEVSLVFVLRFQYAKVLLLELVQRLFSCQILMCFHLEIKRSLFMFWKVFLILFMLENLMEKQLLMRVCLLVIWLNKWIIMKIIKFMHLVKKCKIY